MTGSDGYSAALSEEAFERMMNDPRIRVTDHTNMGSMSEFDVFASFGLTGESERLPDDVRRLVNDLHADGYELVDVDTSHSDATAHKAVILHVERTDYNRQAEGEK